MLAYTFRLAETQNPKHYQNQSRQKFWYGFICYLTKNLEIGSFSFQILCLSLTIKHFILKQKRGQFSLQPTTVLKRNQ